MGGRGQETAPPQFGSEGVYGGTVTGLPGAQVGQDRKGKHKPVQRELKARRGFPCGGVAEAEAGGQREITGGVGVQPEVGCCRAAGTWCQGRVLGTAQVP